MRDKTLIIFDWDGTVMDSVGRIVACVFQTAARSGYPLPSHQAVLDVIGLSLPLALATAFELDHNDEVAVAACVETYKDIYLDLEKTPNPLFSGILALFDSLTTEKKTLAVATGKARRGLERAWAQTQTKHYFQASRTATECLSKPHPQMLEQLLTELNVAKKQAVMVGDSALDLKMAHQAGVDAIGVTYGVHTKDELSKQPSSALVHDVGELREVLFGL